jgi:hypothetical protein
MRNMTVQCAWTGLFACLSVVSPSGELPRASLDAGLNLQPARRQANLPFVDSGRENAKLGRCVRLHDRCSWQVFDRVYFAGHPVILIRRPQAIGVGRTFFRGSRLSSTLGAASWTRRPRLDAGLNLQPAGCQANLPFVDFGRESAKLDACIHLHDLLSAQVIDRALNLARPWPPVAGLPTGVTSPYRNYKSALP